LLKEGAAEKTGSSVTYAMAVRDASLELIGASRGSDVTDEGQMLILLLAACSTFVKKGRIGSNQTAILIKRAADSLYKEMFGESPDAVSPVVAAPTPRDLFFGSGKLSGYALEVIRGMQMLDGDIHTKGKVNPNGSVEFMHGGVYGTVLVEMGLSNDARAWVSVYTTGRRPASIMFPSTFDVKSVAGSKFPRMLLNKLSDLSAWAE
jgi:hypothetical protein